VTEPAATGDERAAADKERASTVGERTRAPLLELHLHGIYCPAGDFYIDPWAPVERAVITHPHPDRAHPGSRHYLTAEPGAALLAEWLGPAASIQPHPYGHSLTLSDCAVSLHPAGHILGSAQVRIEHRGEVWVVSGDYQLAPDPTCTPFEPVKCRTFVTESTFGLPIFRWPQPAEVLATIQAWWRANRDAGRPSLLFANPLGTAQRLLASLDASMGPIYAHPEVERFSRHYSAQGIALASTTADGADPVDGPPLVLAPPATPADDWIERWPRASTAMASGWMRLRGPRRRRTLDRGFVLSSHADWPALLAATDATEAETVWVTGGQRAPLVRWLTEHGRAAVAVEAHFAEDET
jgi:putative mRNA 3-end processing factor